MGLPSSLAISAPSPMEPAASETEIAAAVAAATDVGFAQNVEASPDTLRQHKRRLQSLLFRLKRGYEQAHDSNNGIQPPGRPSVDPEWAKAVVRRYHDLYAEYVWVKKRLEEMEDKQ
eukprot:gnl/Ergobibamus_cyprinoides/3089.p6 GENE.gnl/Ergobibamus_cyprinoides/3089~~gnl/Ergobibamus_cyprinoides/3089.p6  ORF type:complete len:117 (+),score=32.54 gnl/Ergobibamus_cyprinoides/3089:1161-1511(+)